MRAAQLLSQTGAGIAFKLPGVRTQAGLRHGLGRSLKRFDELARHCRLQVPEANQSIGVRRGTSPCRDDGGVGCHALKYLQVTKIDHRLNLRVFQQVGAQILPGAGFEKGGRRDKTDTPTPAPIAKQPNRQLEKVAIQVGTVARHGVALFQVGLESLQALHPHIRRVADNYIKAAARDDVRKCSRPVKGPCIKTQAMEPIVGAGDQTIAD